TQHFGHSSIEPRFRESNNSIIAPFEHSARMTLFFIPKTIVYDLAATGLAELRFIRRTMASSMATTAISPTEYTMVAVGICGAFSPCEMNISAKNATTEEARTDIKRRALGRGNPPAIRRIAEVAMPQKTIIVVSLAASFDSSMLLGGFSIEKRIRPR